MRLTPKIIEEVINEIAGEDVIPLVKLLKNKKNVSEFKLADDLKIGVNIVRNMLYRLHDANLVSFIRKKDKQKGWYIYYWTFNTPRIKFLLKKLRQEKLLKLNERLEREKETQFYICSNQCMRLDFDQAMNFEFKCPECGQLIHQEDNKELIENIEKEIKELEKDIYIKEKKAVIKKKKTEKTVKIKKKIKSQKKKKVKKKVIHKKKVKKKGKKKKK